MFDFPLSYLWFIPLGIAVGAYGTLIGAGGGFVLMPVLILLYPDEPPELLTSISLSVVFFNALSGTAAYWRMKRIDFKSGIIFAAATVPGAILGALTTAIVPRHVFDIILGSGMIAACIFLLFRPALKIKENIITKPPSIFHWNRVLADKDGVRHEYSFNPAQGVIISLLVGYMSSLLGIGGGIIHVPALSYVLGFPIHVATATSQFMLSFMSLTGTLVHIISGVFNTGFRRVFFLALGVIIGAQIGARLSSQLRGPWIIRGLAIGLGVVGIRVILLAL